MSNSFYIFVLVVLAGQNGLVKACSSNPSDEIHFGKITSVVLVVSVPSYLILFFFLLRWLLFNFNISLTPLTFRFDENVLYLHCILKVSRRTSIPSGFFYNPSSRLRYASF